MKGSDRGFRFSFGLGFLLVIAVLLLSGSAAHAAFGSVEQFPANGASNVNPDARLVLTFPSEPVLGAQGQIRVYDAADDRLVDVLDMSIPPGPTTPNRTRVPYIQSPYDYTPTHSTNANTTPGTPSGGADPTPNTYQLTIIGGFTDGFHFYPVIVHGRTATIQLHHNLLDWNKRYYVQIDPGVFTAADGSFQGFAGKSGWTFSTKPAPPPAGKNPLVVSADGSGDFNTVQGAVDFVPDDHPGRATIHIRNGTYEEIVYFRSKSDITFRGESRDGVVICYANNEIFNPHPANIATNEAPGTFPSRRAAFAGDHCSGLELVNLTIKSINEKPAQAEGLLLTGERNIVSNVTIIGSGDALQVNGSAYFVDSKIHGYGDNVLGRGPAFFERCEMVTKGGPHMWVRNTAANHGNVFVDCTFRTDGNAEAVIARAPTNNGRDYPYCEAVLIDCRLQGIRPEGWGAVGPDATHVHYWEFNSTNLDDGKPVDVSRRSPASRQLTMEHDAEIIANFRRPEFVLGGWKPVLSKPPAPTAAKADSSYSPLETFAPLTLPDPVNSYRASNGAPGPDYWQNRADYEIHARLIPETKEITGTEIITYRNNSPTRLDSLWIRLEQNRYRKDSRGSLSMHPRKAVPDKDGAGVRSGVTNGFELDSVEIEVGKAMSKADYLISDTRMQIRLPEPLEPHGRVRVHIAYHYTIPGIPGDRTSWGPSKNGDIFSVAQWYPRMAVFDDLRGWDTLPYLGNEFYLEYGDFDYYITVPADMLVAGGGELLNPEEVLTPLQIERILKARGSDRTVFIRSPDEVNDPASRPKNGGELTWHFRMEDTRDIAFAASRAFIWDAARINLPDGDNALSMSFYPVESVGENRWDRSTEYIKDSVENYSRRWYPYPWPTAVNVGGFATGMEYPGMAFDGIKDKDGGLFWVSAHEIGHSWFPMLVGSNERRNAWMDEGFNTFIGIFESDDFNKGEWGPKRDSEYAPKGGNPVDEIQTTLNDPDAPVIMMLPDVIPEKYRHPVTYFKTALGLVLLREEILGPERFDFAFRKYIRDWAHKHPSPSDFFREMESAGGEDLAWFWHGWFFNNWSLDLAVTGVSYKAGGPSNGATVTIANLDKLVMPATVEIVFADGSKREMRLPVESWIRRKETTLELDSTQPITSVTIDPRHVIPDANRSNNTIDGPFKDSASPATPKK